jgi:hypothetical protein
MARTWPFERLAEPVEPFRGPEDFVARRGPDVTGVIVRIGLCDTQLVLVDRDGTWERWVLPSVEEATAVARALGIALHAGEYPDEVRQAMNARARPLEDFTARAYPEQGRVGPVIPYPENRPRRADEGHHEAEEPPGPHAGVRS